jgi:uncharacterized protein
MRKLTVRRVLGTVLGLGVLAYLGAILYLVSQETRLVFQAERPMAESRPPFPYEQVDLPRSDRARQFAWVMRASDPAHDNWLIFLHGNASTIASRVNIVHYTELRALGLNVLAPEYRGYAGLAGGPSESSLIEDAHAAYEYLRGQLRVPADRIVIYGWSLGSGAAVALASSVPEAAVILEGAPASLVAIGQQQYPIFPIRRLMRNPFESIRRIGRIKAPLLFLHSPEDTIVPILEGRRLYDAAPEPKSFVEVRGGHVHASEVDGRAFFGAVRRFLEVNRLLPAEEDTVVNGR